MPARIALKSGNAAILRGGSESERSSRAIHACLAQGLARAGLPAAAIQILPTQDRSAVGYLLANMTEFIDVIVPRGGKSLIERVQREARVPVIGHLEGNCHVYVDAQADLEMAKRIVLNAKMRRTGICGAAETLLVDRLAAPTHLAPLVAMLLDAHCEVRGDQATRAVDPRVRSAIEKDWYTEYLDAIIAVRVVDGVDEAIAHIARYGSAHTDAIVTQDTATAERFLREVDSAIVLHNASTQFADGGEFGMGAEIGISTDKFHARGPVGVEQLTSYKYVVRGSGQTRPIAPIPPAGTGVRIRGYPSVRRGLVPAERPTSSNNPGFLHRYRAGDSGGAALAVDPSGVAGDVVLLLPDRHAVLDFVDDEAAGLKRFAAMARAHADPHGEFADFERADAMHAQRMRDAEALDGRAHDALAFLDREFLERFVLESPHLAAFVVIAHPAFERREPARRGIRELGAQERAVDRRAREAKEAHPPATGGMKTTLSPSASGVVQSRNSALIATLSCSRVSWNG